MALLDQLNSAIDALGNHIVSFGEQVKAIDVEGPDISQEQRDALATRIDEVTDSLSAIAERVSTGQPAQPGDPTTPADDTPPNTKAPADGEAPGDGAETTEPTEPAPEA